VTTLRAQPDEPPRSAPLDESGEADVENGADGLEHAAEEVEPPEITAFVNRSPQEASNREARRREAEEDRELIGLAKNGDQAAFRKLVERHQRRAFAIAVGLVRDENDARELVQEAFLRVYRGLDSFQGGSSFFTWLYRIVTNLAIDLMRKPGRKDAELLDNQAADEEPSDFPLVSRIDGSDPIDVMRRREIAGRIQAALDALPPYHRGVILMREVEGMSYEEMAQAMGVSKGTIMSRLFHARQKLQRALADCYAEQGPARRAVGDAQEEGGDDSAAEEAS
jgi:RNA polymerase sigma-70 factor (ECF subfamily)